MNRQAKPNMFAATGAVSILVGDNTGPCGAPAPPPVGFGATNPVRSALATQRHSAVFVPTDDGAIVRPGTLRLPRLAFEWLAAGIAREVQRSNPTRACLAANLLRGEGIRRTATFAERIAGQVEAAKLAMGGMPSAAARITAEPGGGRTIGLYIERLAANLARLGYHERIIPPFAGSGSTGVACVHEGIAFIGIEAEEEYAEIATRRIAHAVGPLFKVAD